jgi:hypothetical protein
LDPAGIWLIRDDAALSNAVVSGMAFCAKLLSGVKNNIQNNNPYLLTTNSLFLKDAAGKIVL